MRRDRVIFAAALWALGVAIAVWGLVVRGAWGQQGARPTAHEHTKQAGGQGTADGMGKNGHERHGPPPAWRFTLPKGGDPVKGRAVFLKFQCFACHEVTGETFPAPTGGGAVGPELSGMAAHHPPEFFAESIINPGAVIDKDRGYVAPDGSSKMPSSNEDLTVQELLDLVAHLVNLKPPAGPGGAPASSGPGDHQGHGK